jgi:hypothetical protein
MLQQQAPGTAHASVFTELLKSFPSVLAAFSGSSNAAELGALDTLVDQTKLAEWILARRN